MIPTDYVHCCVIGFHGNHCCIWFEHNVRLFFFGGGGFKLFLYIYISMIIQNLIVKFHI